VSKRPPPTILLYIYGGSILLHGALAVGAILLPKSTTKEAVAIELREAKKAKEPPKPPPPAPPPPSTAEKPKPRPAPVTQQAQAKVAPEAKTEAPPPLPVGADGFADLGGVALGNAEGPGLAVPGAVAAAAAVAPAATATTTTHKVQQLAASQTDMCVEPVVRPKRKVPVVPKYTLEARQAEIEGVVRVEVTVDETGQVVNARVVSGLGYGLDDAALVAARASTFEPATRCKKPVIGTTILPFRFQET
jgi:protein TonB